MEEGLFAAVGVAILIGLTWFFITCTNNHYDPEVKIKEQQLWDLKHIRCKEMCSGSVKSFNMNTCKCQ